MRLVVHVDCGRCVLLEPSILWWWTWCDLNCVLSKKWNHVCVYSLLSHLNRFLVRGWARTFEPFWEGYWATLVLKCFEWFASAGMAWCNSNKSSNLSSRLRLFLPGLVCTCTGFVIYVSLIASYRYFKRTLHDAVCRIERFIKFHDAFL
jgi:hypothetical protein